MKITCTMSKDENMIRAYNEGKDLYAVLASVTYKKPYEECLEFNNGVYSAEGKKRRTTAKAIALGICYGKSPQGIAEDLKITSKEAQNIYDTLLEACPDLKSFMDKTLNFAKKNGFVQDLWGRKRRLPDILLPEFEYISGDKQIAQVYLKKLLNATTAKQRNFLINDAFRQGIEFKNNRGFISKAERQSLNSQIQGGGATQMKLAMINVGTNKRLKELGFRMLISVHDELLGEAPKENIKEVKKIFEQCMLDSGKDLIVPTKIDMVISECWGGNEIEI